MLPLTLQSVPFEPPRVWQAAIAAAIRQPFAAVFDSALPGETATHSYISFAPTMLLQISGQRALWQRGRHASQLEGNPLDVFERVERFTHQECPLRQPVNADGFIGGWAGLLGFDLRCAIEKVPPPRPDGPAFPDLQAAFYPWTLCHDHATGTCELRLLHGAPGGPEDIGKLAQRLHEALSGADVHDSELCTLDSALLITDRATWLAAVSEVKRNIHEGEIYQANLSRLVRRVGKADPASLYTRLREHNPAPYCGVLDCGDGRYVLSSSPERFLSVRDGVIETRPIKGTRARSNDAAEDARLRSELEHSEKDHAELTMIVDLERNDFGKLCKPGTISVPELARIHSYARVHHLEATVRGELRDDATPAGIFRATFPGGSISGAPKKRALEIIHQLEPVRRGPYTGSLFWLSPNGRLESSILIRTLLLEPGGVSYHVGCGIVADSDPAAEWDETLAKASALEAALGAP